MPTNHLQTRQQKCAQTCVTECTLMETCDSQAKNVSCASNKHKPDLHVHRHVTGSELNAQLWKHATQKQTNCHVNGNNHKPDIINVHRHVSRFKAANTSTIRVQTRTLATVMPLHGEEVSAKQNTKTKHQETRLGPQLKHKHPTLPMIDVTCERQQQTDSNCKCMHHPRIGYRLEKRHACMNNMA